VTRDLCQPAKETRRQIHRVERERLAAILAARPEARVDLVAAATTELEQMRLEGQLRLPVGGCAGLLCLNPFVASKVNGLKALLDGSETQRRSR
jgi:hypothetical protein